LVGQVPVFAFVEPGTIAMKAPHAVFGAGFKKGDDFEEVAIANKVFYRVGGHEHLAFGDAHLEVFAEMEALGDDGDEAISELSGDAALDFGGERADDALESFGASGGVHSGENEVTRLRCAQSEPHCFGVPHFAHHEDVGIFAERIEECLFEAWGVAADFALADVAFLRAESVFDRTFDSDNMARLGAVDFLEQGGESGGFSGPSGAADKDQAVMMVDELFEIGMKVEFLDSGLERGKEPNGKADAASGLKDVQAAADPSDVFGEIGGAAFEKMLPLIVAKDAAGGVKEILRSDRIANGAQGATDAHRGRKRGFEVKIAGAFLFCLSD